MKLSKKINRIGGSTTTLTKKKQTRKKVVIDVSIKKGNKAEGINKSTVTMKDKKLNSKSRETMS